MFSRGFPRSLVLLFLALGVFFPTTLQAPVSWAQEKEADLQWALAETLSGKGQHYRAITEYERFIFYFPQDKRAQAAKVRILESYVAGKWWPEGVKAAQEVLEDSQLPAELRCRVLELLGVCQMRMGDSGKARETLGKALELCASPEARDRIRLLLAELEAGLGRWGAVTEALEAMEDRQEAAQIKKGQFSSQQRSSWMAGILAALFPGAGHAYLGRWEDAALVFMVNGAFLGATWEAVQKNQPALAGGMALAELVWYSGNIFSAVSNAHKHNRELLQEWSRGMAWQLGPWGPEP